MVTWIPYSRVDIPVGWRKLWLTDHFQETSVNTLDENYKSKWNDRAKRALKKYEKSGAEVRSVDADTFVKAFSERLWRDLLVSITSTIIVFTLWHSLERNPIQSNDEQPS